MERPDDISTISEPSQGVSNQIRSLMMAANTGNTDNKPKAVEMPIYRNFCRDFLGEDDPISDDVIRVELERVRSTTKLRKLFLENHRCCVTVIPCSRYGNLLGDSEIKSKMYFAMLTVDETGKTVGGFTSDDSRIFDLQPVEIQSDCTFNIGMFEPLPPPDKNNYYPFDVSPADRTRLIAEYERVLRNAQARFRKEVNRYDVN
jgi:hypothetical protein